MSSGVTVTEEVVSSCEDFKLRRGQYGGKWVLYKISDDKKRIVIDQAGGKDSSYEVFISKLPDDDCRYGLVDVEFETPDGRPTDKMVFISWVPDTAKIRSKMLYSASKEAIKNVMSGIGIHINATDHSELDLETAILPVARKYTVN